MLVKLSGSVKLPFSFVQLLKAQDSMTFSPFGNVSVPLNPLQALNAPYPIDPTELGMTRSPEKFVPMKASLPIDFTDGGMTNLPVRDTLRQKALSPMCVTVVGMLRLSSFRQFGTAEKASLGILVIGQSHSITNL